MISLKNDYAEGAHPRILEAFAKSNLVQAEGYGEDQFVLEAKEHIQSKIDVPCDIHFLSGGTQANLALISHALRQHQGVISPDTGHIAVNETGAIEATGHKVITGGAEDGKLTPAMILSTLAAYNKAPHVVQPKMVYISQTTELGTLYTKPELEALHNVCREKELLLYVDGARMAMALAALEGKLTLSDMAKLTDAFTVGGTKCGALMGEALIISNPELARDFRYTLKQKGALLAKGRVLGIQFEALFRDNLYIELGAHANRLGTLLRDLLKEAGCKFFVESPTNQQFVVLPDIVIGELAKEYGFNGWGRANETHSVIRLITSWATKEEDVRRFAKGCGDLLKKAK